MAREKMAAPFQSSSHSVALPQNQPEFPVLSSENPDPEDPDPANPDPEDPDPENPDSTLPPSFDKVKKGVPADDSALRAEVSKLVSRVLAKAVSEVCMEPASVETQVGKEYPEMYWHAQEYPEVYSACELDA